MGVKSILFIIALFLLSSCTFEQPVDDQSKALIFIVDGNEVEDNTRTFVITEDDPLAWFDQTREKRYHKNLRRNIEDYEDEQEEIAFKQKYANVRRTVENEFGQSVMIVGYDKELDNPDFEEVD